MKKKIKIRFIILFLILGIFFTGSLRSGFSSLTMNDIFRIMARGGTAEENLILFDFRMVRLVLAILIGAGLSVSGAVFQAVSKNPMASPDLLGVSAGAGMAVMLYTFVKPDGNGGNIFLLPVIALTGAFAAATFIYFMAHRKEEGISPKSMVLVGIELTAGINGADILIEVLLSTEQFHQVNTWMIGSVYGNSWKHVAALLPWVLVLIPVLFMKSSDLDLLQLKDESSISLGMELKKNRFLYLILAVALAAACVSIGGAIGFIGLICPHLAARLVGASHRYRIPAAALLGAILLLGADWIARTVIAPDELLLGIVVALVGAPYFLYILLKQEKGVF